MYPAPARFMCHSFDDENETSTISGPKMSCSSVFEEKLKIDIVNTKGVVVYKQHLNVCNYDNV